MILEHGRPAGGSRLPRELRVYDFLDSLALSYDRVDHAAADNMEVCKEVDEVLDAQICKNLFLCNRQQTKFYLLMMPADKPFKTKELSAQINSARLSFAGADKMLEFLDILPGSVSVMGLMNDKDDRVTLLVDDDLMDKEYLGCHPCVNTSSLRLKTKDVFEVFVPAVNHSVTTVKLVGNA